MSDRKILQEYHNTTIQDYVLNIIQETKKPACTHLHVCYKSIHHIIYITHF